LVFLAVSFLLAFQPITYMQPSSPPLLLHTQPILILILLTSPF
jgi:hypothetical protein